MVKGPSWLAKLGTLSLLYVSVFLTRIGFGSILVIFPYYLNIPLTNSSLAGFIIALYPAVEGFSALPVGTFVDLRGRRKAFVAGMTMISILTLLIGVSNNLVLVGGAHALEGLAAAMVTVASLTMITDLTVKENSGASMGGIDLANLGGYGTGIVLGFFLFLPRLVKNAGVTDLAQSAPLILLALLVLGVGSVMFGRLSDKIGRMKTMLIGTLGELGFLLVLPDLFQRLVVIPPNTPWIDSYNMVGPIIIVGGILFFLVLGL